MNKPARHLSDLDTREIEKRYIAYSQLLGQCVRVLQARGGQSEELINQSMDAFAAGRDPRGEEDETAAMEWIRFIVNESFNPFFDDPEEELTRIQRYLVTASLVASESGIILEDDEA